MKIYLEMTGQEVTAPDLSAGYLYDGVFVTGYTEPVVEVIPETVTADRPEGLRRTVPARPVTEACQWYHPYTEEELAARQDGSVDERLDALEDQLSAAKILLGVE